MVEEIVIHAAMAVVLSSPYILALRYGRDKDDT